MTQPSQSNEALLRDIQAPLVAHERAAFWWMGQHTFVVKIGTATIFIDPFLADWSSRQTPPLLTMDETSGFTWALVSHGHGDHLCPQTLKAIAANSPDCRFVCPQTETHRLEDEAGISPSRIMPLNADDSVTLHGTSITAIKSKHEFFDEHPELGFPYLGYVIERDGVTIYHSGDTIPYEGLLTTLQKWSHFDCLFLPINGRDAERFTANCQGNLTFQESVEIAGELQPGLVVPSHYDMFIGNQEDPAKFARYIEAKYPTVRYWIGAPGSRVTIS